MLSPVRLASLRHSASHRFGSPHAEQPEPNLQHPLHRRARYSRAARTAGSDAEDPVAVVETVERAGHIDEVEDDPVRLQLQRRLLDHVRELASSLMTSCSSGSPALSRSALARRRAPTPSSPPGGTAADARVGVLHVEDRVLRRLLLGQFEVEVEVAVAPCA